MIKGIPTPAAQRRQTPSSAKHAPAQRSLVRPKSSPIAADDQPDESGDDASVSRAKPRVGFWTASAIAVTITIAAMTLIGAFRQQHEPGEAPHQPVATSNFAHCKAAPGLVEAVTDERQLSFEIGGKIRDVFVEEGQSIRAGEAIAELENADLAAKLKAAQANAGLAEARFGILNGNLQGELQKAVNDVTRLKAELALLEPRPEDIDQAQADAKAAQFDAQRCLEDAQRYSDPEKAGHAWPQEKAEQTRRLADIAQAKFESASARLRALKAGSRAEEKARLHALQASAEAEVARQHATRDFQLKAAQEEVEQAHAQVELARAELGKTRIVAPINGTVLRKFLHPGEVIDALHPQAVVVVADLSRLRVRADVDEADFPYIKIGQRVKIRADALKEGTYLTGTVEMIGDITGQKRFSTGEAREHMDVKVVETLVKFDTPPSPEQMKIGLRVTAYFDLGN